MATLKQRLYHDMPSGDTDTTISVHQLYAAVRLYDLSLITAAQMREMFDITAAEQFQIQGVIDAVGEQMLNDVLILVEGDKLTSAQADTLLGL